MADSSTKEVVVKFRVEQDAKAGQPARDLANQARKTQDDINSAHKKGISEREKFFKEEQDKYDAAATRRNASATREEEKGIRDRSAAIRRGMVERQREQERAAATADRAAKLHEKADQRMVASMLRVGGSAMNLARDFAMLGLLGEKDTQKLLEGLLRIGIGFDLVKGGIGLVHNLATAYNAVAAAAKAAAVAQAASAAVAGARGGTAAAGLAAGAGVGGTLFGVGAAAGASTAAALAMTALTIREASKYGIGGGAEVGGIVDRVGGSRYNPFYWPIADFEGGGFRGSGPSPERMRRESEEALKRQQARMEMQTYRQQLQEIEARRASAEQAARFTGAGSSATLAGLGMTGAARDLAVAQAQGRFAAMESASAARDVAAASPEESTAALERQRDALTYLRQAEENRAAAASKYVQEQVRALSMLREQKNAMAGMAERWLDMNPAQRAMGNRAIGKLDAGQDLTAEERRMIHAYGSSALEEKLAAANLRQARNMPGFQSLESRQSATDQAALPQGVKSIDDVVANLKRASITIDKNMSDQKIAKALTDGLTAIQDATAKKLDAITQQIAKIMQEQAARAQQQAAHDMARQPKRD